VRSFALDYPRQDKRRHQSASLILLAHEEHAVGGDLHALLEQHLLESAPLVRDPQKRCSTRLI
jgi:hypothetical protein